jgi:hypothetical protein
MNIRISFFFPKVQILREVVINGMEQMEIFLFSLSNSKYYYFLVPCGSFAFAKQDNFMMMEERRKSRKGFA